MSVREAEPSTFRQRLREFTPKPLHAPDAATVLSVYLFLLVAIPSDRGIAQLGAAGSPAGLFAMGMLLWWVWHHLRGLRLRGHVIQPVRIGLVVFAGCVLASYIASAQLALPFVDSNAATMNLLKMAGFAGVVLVMNDGLRDRERFLVLLNRVAWAGGLYALLGLIQFVTGENFVSDIDIPGLGSSGSGGVDSRGDFVRPEATARHTLEYASVITVTLPIALTLAMYGTSRHWIRRWLPTAFIALAAVLSVTRSALLGVVVVMAILVPTWAPRIRKTALLVMLVGAVVLYVAVPGLAGTIMGMFSGSDPSIDSRTASYSSIGAYLQVSPWIGRGLGTMTADYRIFDNQYIGLMIEIGLIGLAAFLALILVSAGCALWPKKLDDPLIKALGPALGAATLAGAMLSAFFDSFHFPQALGVLSLTVGLCGAYWNVAWSLRQEKNPKPHEESLEAGGLQRVARTYFKRWYAAVLVVACLVPVGIGIRQSSGVYYTSFDVIFQAPDGATKDNALRTEASSTVHYAAIVQRMYADTHNVPDVRPVRAALYGVGIRDLEAVYLPSSGGQWQSNFNKAQITVEIVKENPDEALRRADEISKEISRLSKNPQDSIGVWKSSQITTDRVATTVPVGYINVRTKYALATLGILGIAASVVATQVADALIRAVSRHRAKSRPAPEAARS